MMKKNAHLIAPLAVLIFFCMCLSANLVYAMGGGSGNGDGRWNFTRPTGGSAGGNSSDSDGQQSQTATYSGNGSYSCWDKPGDPSGTPVTMPEPITAILLGLGVIGLAAAKRELAR